MWSGRLGVVMPGYPWISRGKAACMFIWFIWPRGKEGRVLGTVWERETGGWLTMGPRFSTGGGGLLVAGAESSSLPTTVHSMQSGVFELYMLLYALRPTHVVMYDIEMSVVRQLEVYQANHPAKQIKVTMILVC